MACGCAPTGATNVVFVSVITQPRYELPRAEMDAAVEFHSATNDGSKIVTFYDSGSANHYTVDRYLDDVGKALWAVYRTLSLIWPTLSQHGGIDNRNQQELDSIDAGREIAGLRLMVR